MNAVVTRGIEVDEFDEIELFSKYVQEHSQEFASIMTRVSGSDDLVRAANRLGFAISNDQRDAYVRARSARTSHSLHH